MALFIFFRFPALFLFSIAYGYAKEKCLGKRKNLKSCPYTTSIIIKSIEKGVKYTN